MMHEAAPGLTRDVWSDLPDYIVHFTKNSAESGARNLENMLLTGSIQARGKFGVGRYYQHCPLSVCMSELSISQFAYISKQRGKYALGFDRQFIQNGNGAPLFQVHEKQYEIVALLIRSALNDPSAPIWSLVSFIDRVLPNRQLGWEREWRIPNDLAFTPDAVRFIFLPEKEHAAFINLRLNAQQKTGMPVYQCPVIDPQWQADRIRPLLAYKPTAA